MTSIHNLAPPNPAPDWGNPENLDPIKARMRLQTLNRGGKFFFHVCGNCGGESPHDLVFGECVECYPALRHSILRPGENMRRIAARRSRSTTYLDTCPECGPETPHHIRNSKCATCYAASGKRRRVQRAVPPARREAELAGRRRYVHECILHGTVEHHTRRGICLECFDTQGAPRAAVYMSFCRDCEDLTAHEIVTRSCTACDPVAAHNVNSFVTR